jgi:NAD(P)H-hydrate epimerase
MSSRVDPLGLLPAAAADSLPWLSADEMRAIDDLASGAFRIELKQMMENAGRHLAEAARLLLGGSVRGASIVVLAGKGGNGGGGLVGARHLVNAGARVHVVLGADRTRLATVTRAQLEILDAIAAGGSGLPGDDPDLVVDALLGYAQSGAPRGELADLIDAVQGLPVLSLDVPSGLELATGELHTAHVDAQATVTLAAPKSGLRPYVGAGAVGQLLLADISIPGSAFVRIGHAWKSPFDAGPLVRVV